MQIIHSLKKSLKIFSKEKRYHEVTKVGGTFSPIYLGRHRVDYLGEYQWWVFTAISVIAQRSASLDYHFLDERWETIDSEYTSLITYNLIEACVSYLKLTGSCYIWKATIWGKIRDLQVLRPDLITPKFDSNKANIVSYEYHLNGKTVKFKAEEIIAIHQFSPLQAYPFVCKGMSDVQAWSVAIDMDRASSVWNWKFFENGANPWSILETDATLSDEQYDRIKTSWEQEHGGVNNSHKVAILEWGLKMSNASRSTQKDMDFVEGRKFTRDEIFSIFKVPKACIWLGDGANANMNIGKFDILLARNAIYPIAVKIQEALSVGLFGAIERFEFINVVPFDSEEVRNDFNSGIITLNEARSARWYDPIKNGDTIKGSDIVASIAPKSEGNIKKSLDTRVEPLKSEQNEKIKSIFRSNLKGTQEYYDTIAKKRDKRLEKFVESIVWVMQKVSKEQEKDILGSLKNKALKSNIPQLDSVKYQTLYLGLLADLYIGLYDQEGNAALEELGLSLSFQVGDPEVQEIRDTIAIWSKSVDVTTNTKLRDAIASGIDQWVGSDIIASSIKDIFGELSSSRADMIARTEVIQASTNAQLRSWDQSWVVEGKQWITTEGDRTCPLCKAMDRKKIGLKENFFELGDSLQAGEEQIEFTFRAVNGPVLHPRCRCALAPVVD